MLSLLNREAGNVIDLSSASYAPQPAAATLSPAELNDLIEVVSEVYAEPEPAELSDSGLDQLMQAAERSDAEWSEAVSDFDAAFNARVQADAARADAIAAAEVQDALHPARRDEDKMQRIISRAQDGLYGGQLADFTAEAASVEILLANGGRGPCGPADDFGRCSSRYHDLECSHSQGVDWVASGPPASTGEAALANFQAGVELANLAAGQPVWAMPTTRTIPATWSRPRPSSSRTHLPTSGACTATSRPTRRHPAGRS